MPKKTIISDTSCLIVLANIGNKLKMKKSIVIDAFKKFNWKFNILQLMFPQVFLIFYAIL